MKNIFRIALAALALALPVLPLAANCGDCCWDPCKGGPLCCGKLSVMVKGGVTPSSYTHRGRTWVTSNNTALPAAVFSPLVVGKFSQQFNVPWNVGAEVAWNASCRIQFFLEYAHTQAKGKSRGITVPVGTASLDLTTVFCDYDVNAGYLGARYFFEGCCFPCLGKIAPYVGFKTGFAVQQGVKDRLFDATGAIDQSFTYWLGKTHVSGGLQIGLEWWFCNCLSLVLQGEFVATCGPTPNQNVVVDPAIATLTSITNINIGGTDWLIAWPVTLGLRFTF